MVKRLGLEVALFRVDWHCRMDPILNENILLKEGEVIEFILFLISLEMQIVKINVKI